MSLTVLVQEIKDIKPSDFTNKQESFIKLFQVYEQFQKGNVEDLNEWNRLFELDFDSFLVKLLAHQVEKSNDYTDLDINERTHDDLLISINYNDDGSEDYCEQRHILTTYFMAFILHKITSLQFRNDDLIEFNKRLVDKNLCLLLADYFKSKFFRNSLTKMTVWFLETYKQLSENFFYKRDNFDAEAAERLVKRNQSDYVKKYMLQLEYNIKSNSLVKCLENLNEFKPKRLIPNYGKDIYSDLITLVNIVSKPQFKDFKILKKYKFDQIFLGLADLIYKNKELLIDSYEIKPKENVESEMRYVSVVQYVGPIDSTKYETNFQTISHFYPQPVGSKDNKLSDIFEFLLTIMNNLIYSSIECNLAFSSRKMIKRLVSFLSDLGYLSKFKNAPNFLIYLLSTLSIMSKLSEENMDYWTEYKAVKVLLKLDEFYTFKSSTKEISSYIYNCLGYIANDNKLETLEKIRPFIKTLLEYLGSISESIKSNKYLSKIKTEVYNSKREIVKVDVIYYNKSVIGILHQLTRFALNSKLKLVIFRKFNNIKTILYNGNDIEKYYALKLIAQLCLSEENAGYIQSDKEFIDFIEDLSTKSKESQFSISKVCENILMSLELIQPRKYAVVCQSSNRMTKQEKLSDGQIMISYNWSTQEFCLKIRDELVKNGYKVWMDVDKMEDRIHASMAKAVETSSIVLICYCEKYKLSENCELEAIYAKIKKKHIIPIPMQLGYEEADGWLGILLSDRLYEDFMNKPFDVGFEGLKSKINKMLRPEEIPQQEQKKVEPEKENEKQEVIHAQRCLKPEDWESDKVNEWFRENKLSELLCLAYGKIDGDSLKQLYEIYCITPEFFYQSIAKETNNQLQLSDVSMFISKLKKLFKN